jgi:hypothetical protein
VSSKVKKVDNIAGQTNSAMINPPKPVESLPSLEHNGVEIICRIHNGFSTPSKGPVPAPRYLYGAVSPEGERHWRRSLNDIQALIDAGFKLNTASASKE